MGFTNVKVFHAGLPAWKKSGGLVLTGPVALENWLKAGSSFVLVDLRDPAEAAKGAIPDSIGVPAQELAAWKDRFPENKKAPIVLVDAGAGERRGVLDGSRLGLRQRFGAQRGLELLEGRVESRRTAFADEDRLRQDL